MADGKKDEKIKVSLTLAAPKFAPISLQKKTNVIQLKKPAMTMKKEEPAPKAPTTTQQPPQAPGTGSRFLPVSNSSNNGDLATTEVYSEFVKSFGNPDSANEPHFVKSETVINKQSSFGDDLDSPVSAAPVQDPYTSRESLEPQTKKGKEKEKKMSNLEEFKLMLKRQQEEREAREKGRSKGGKDAAPAGPSLSELPPVQSLGSFDTGDPTTTNVHVGNLPPTPDINELWLCNNFGPFGPLASVKIMWPRTAEEKSRGRLTGFVAFMKRADAERALAAFDERIVNGHALKCGWGKGVTIPPQPIFSMHPLGAEALDEDVEPPTGLPFNAMPQKDKEREAKGVYSAVAPSAGSARDQMIKNAKIFVKIPKDKVRRQLIHRFIEFVVLEGPMFEALVMHRSVQDPKFRFLFDHESADHIYYRWRLFAVLQGDEPSKWRTEEFRMYKGGSVWVPPPCEDETKETKEKGRLTNKQRDQLEDMIRDLTMERASILEAMMFCITESHAAEEIVECISQSLSILHTPVHIKIARLFLLSDLLHNSAAKVTNAGFYRRAFEERLPEIFVALNLTYRAISGRLRAEIFKKHVMTCLRAWSDWSVYTPEVLSNLETIFLADPKKEAKPAPPIEQNMGFKSTFQAPGDEGEDLDGTPLNLGGVRPWQPNTGAVGKGVGNNPSLEDDDIDGKPLPSYNTSRPAWVGVADDEEDLVGVPLGAPQDLKRGRTMDDDASTRKKPHFGFNYS